MFDKKNLFGGFDCFRCSQIFVRARELAKKLHVTREHSVKNTRILSHNAIE